MRCQVASFFEGGQYLKITQMEIRDVRLVYAPALGVGNFGDEIDNWMWPRHTGDFGFYRAYVGKDGKPADFSKDERSVPAEALAEDLHARPRSGRSGDGHRHARRRPSVT